MSDHIVIKDDAYGEVVVKKSRFLAHLHYVENEADAEAFIRDKKKQYHDARHNCHCYIVGEDVKKSSDDGEPSGTAGRPMLEVLEGEGLINVVAVVTRYFGGILLGTGGLVRAYQDAVKEALNSATFLHAISVNEIIVTLDYNNYRKLDNLIRSNNLFASDVSYMENVTAKIKIPVEKTNSIVRQITEMTFGKAHIERDDEEYTIFSD